MATVHAFLAAASRQLRAAGNPTPALDAQLWLAHLCGLSRAQLLTHPEQELGPELADRFWDGLARLEAGEPLPYLTGRAEFYGLTFRVSPATLIPRPETEHLVDTMLQLLRSPALSESPAPVIIADIGTGSGCIAISVALHHPAACLLAVDVSPEALKVAAHNAVDHGVADRISFLEGDLLLPLGGAVQHIMANLPYITDREWAELPSGVRDYEPAEALRGGPQGLDLIQRLLQQAPSVLLPGAAVLLEIGAAQGADALAMAKAVFPDADIRLQQDYAGRDRLLLIQTG